MTTTTKTEQNIEYLYFLFGILLYELFGFIWGKCFLFIIDLGKIVFPIPVEIGTSVIQLTIFCYLFRKPHLLNIKWIHIVGISVLIVIMVFVDYIIRIYLLPPYISDDYYIAINTLSNVRKWKFIFCSLFIIAYLWWHYRDKNKTNEMKNNIPRCFYGGILFYFTFSLILYTFSIIAEQCKFLQHPLPLNIIANLMFILFTIGAVYLLIKKQHRISFSFVIIFILIIVYYISFYYLYDILIKYNLIVEKSFHSAHWCSFVNLSNLCNLSFFIVVFILYRKRMKVFQLAKKN